MGNDRSQRTVLVTGANSGIGLATVLEVARRGYRTVGTVRSKAKASEVRTLAAVEDLDITVELLDVADADGCERVIDEHRPWGLVNNAGYSVAGAVEDVTDDEARAVLEVMVVAPMRLARLALPHMRTAGDGGRIINVSSIYGFTSTALTGWYQGSKHALEGLSDALRIEVAADGIAVVLIEPGGLRTGIWAETEAGLTGRDGSRYAESYQRSLDLTKRYDAFMEEPTSAAKSICGALDASSPRARYLVGKDAWMLAAYERVAITPVKDRLNRFILGL